MGLFDRMLTWRPGTAGGEAATRQVGAIPFTVLKGQVVFLLVTSRRTGRWIFPKGGLEADLAPWEVAAQEAFEEAGVEGTVERQPIGSYGTVKLQGFRRLPLLVEMYPLRIARQFDDWPEKRQRHRHFVLLGEARRLLAERRLVELATALDRRERQALTAQKPRAKSSAA